MLTIEGYALRRSLGVGATSEVFEAIREIDQKYVALKVFSPIVTTDPSVVKRLQNEADVLVKLQHPNVVLLQSSVKSPKHFCLDLELVVGQDLRRWAQNYHLPLIEPSLWVLAQIARGLGAAHEIGVILTQLVAALEHPATYKYIQVQSEIAIDRGYAVRGSIALHGPGKLVFRRGSLRMSARSTTDYRNCNVGRLEQSLRFLVATENPEITSDQNIHIVFQAPVVGKIDVPKQTFLALGFYTYEVRANDMNFLFTYGAKVKTWWRDFGAADVLSVNSTVSNQSQLGRSVPTCMDSISQKSSYFSNSHDVCGTWAETAANWKSCGVAQ